MSDVWRFRLFSILLLAGGASLYSAVPFVLARHHPHSQYIQGMVEGAIPGLSIPHILCAVIWLPWRSDEVQLRGTFVSALLLVATFVSYYPYLFEPQNQGGDMMFLGLSQIAIFLIIGVIMVSALAGLHAVATRHKE